MGRRLNTSETSDKNKLEKLQVWVGDLFRYSGLWRVRFLKKDVNVNIYYNCHRVLRIIINYSRVLSL